MEDELVCVNVSLKNMPSYISYDGETVSNLSDVPGEVGKQNKGFGQDVRETKVPITDDVWNQHERRGSKESNEKETIRRPSAVDILRRNFGTSKSSVLNDSNVGHPKDYDKVEKILQNLEHGRLAGNGRTQWGSNRGSNSKLPDFFTSLDLEDLELSTSEGKIEINKGGDESLSEEHVYCTVYCIANDDSKKPSESTGILDNGISSSLDVSASSPTESLNPDINIGQYPEAYTVADLVDSTMLNNVHNADYNLSVVLTCRICFDDRHIKPLHCCKKAVCEDCLKTYITSQVLVGQADIACPITECSGYLEENVVVAHLAAEEVAKYRYFLEVSRLDSSTKPCPQCSLFTSLKGRNLHAPGKGEHKYKIQCTDCQFVWCFKCHAPWHDGLKCREYRKGDKLLRHWASVIEHGQRNAQKCPRCKIHIQRTEGCDHMTCTQCNTNFCYRCGEKYRHLRFFGDHTSNLSVFGCKYRYLPERPHLRRLARGSVCMSKMLVAPVVVVLVVVVGTLALIIGLVAFPVYYIYKKHRKHSNGTGRWLC